MRKTHARPITKASIVVSVLDRQFLEQLKIDPQDNADLLAEGLRQWPDSKWRDLTPLCAFPVVPEIRAEVVSTYERRFELNRQRWL